MEGAACKWGKYSWGAYMWGGLIIETLRYLYEVKIGIILL